MIDPRPLFGHLTRTLPNVLMETAKKARGSLDPLTKRGWSRTGAGDGEPTPARLPIPVAGPSFLARFLPQAPSAPSTPDTSLNGVLGKWRRLGWVVVVVFIGGSFLWAATTRLDSAVVAQGVVGVESNLKTVQHLEGGIVKEILVSEGDKVVAGAVLVRLDDTQPRSILATLEDQLVAVRVQKARLESERDERREVEFPDDLLEMAGDPKVAELMLTQMDIFNSRRSTIGQQQSILQERIQKIRSEISGLRAQLTSSRQQLAFIQEELGGLKVLLADGLVPKTRVLALERTKAEIIGQIGQYRAEIARAEEGIGEIKLQLAMPDSKNQNKVTENIDKALSKIADLRERIFAASDILNRTEIRAPQSGTVHDLKVHTTGGVVQPGQQIVALVPDLDGLVLDLKVDPNDIDAVFKGMPARARMTAFSARTTPAVEGVVTVVSPDRITDPATGVSYFTARMRPVKSDGGLDPAELSPGMQADVYLVTSQRTVLDFVLDPLTRSLQRAGREL